MLFLVSKNEKIVAILTTAFAIVIYFWTMNKWWELKKIEEEKLRSSDKSRLWIYLENRKFWCSIICFIREFPFQTGFFVQKRKENEKKNCPKFLRTLATYYIQEMLKDNSMSRMLSELLSLILYVFLWSAPESFTLWQISCNILLVRENLHLNVNHSSPGMDHPNNRSPKESFYNCSW